MSISHIQCLHHVTETDDFFEANVVVIMVIQDNLVAGL